MQYLVQMNLVAAGRPSSAEDGANFIEQFILPTLELCKKLQEQKKILAGGPTSGAIGLVLIVRAASAEELDDLITSLPVWPRMETEVTPLTTFEGRALTLRPRLERSKTNRETQPRIGGGKDCVKNDHNAAQEGT